ncbi:MAG: MATE family efflux transporter [Pseudoruegeria sp.]
MNDIVSRLFNFIAFARPMIFSQLLMISIGLTDTIVLGMLGTEELSSGGLVNSYELLATIVVTGFGIGVIPVNGRAFGLSDKDGLANNFAAGFALFLILVAIGCLGLTGLPLFLSWLDISSEIVSRGRTYSYLMAVSFIFGSLAVFMRFYLISINGAKYLDWIFLGAFAVNLALNLLLAGLVVEQISFGLIGIAISTVVTNVCLILVLIQQVKKNLPEGKRRAARSVIGMVVPRIIGDSIVEGPIAPSDRNRSMAA